jgi:phosphoribosylanthranilate isomerase
VIRIKTCGITSEEDLELCAEAGADAVGLVVEYPLPVPWTLSRLRARELSLGAPRHVDRVAVVGGDAATILSLVAAVEPTAVQLHLDEPPETVAAVREGLEGSGVSVVKAVRITADSGRAAPAEHWLAVARRFVEAGAHRILLDSKTSTRPAGTGVAFDWAIAREVAAGLGAPLSLAGGLTPENVADAVREVRPYEVDVISSLEDERHRKVPERVRAFVAAVRAASFESAG